MNVNDDNRVKSTDNNMKTNKSDNIETLRVFAIVGIPVKKKNFLTHSENFDGLNRTETLMGVQLLSNSICLIIGWNRNVNNAYLAYESKTIKLCCF